MLCLGALIMYIDAHKPSQGGRCASLSLQYATKIMSLPKHPAHNAVLIIRYMEMFDEIPKLTHTVLAFASNGFYLLPSLIHQTF